MKGTTETAIIAQYQPIVKRPSVEGKQLKKKKKAFTCMLEEQTIVQLREAAQSEKVSQGALLEKTIESYLGGNRSTSESIDDGTKPTIEPIVEYFKDIISTKDAQINKLIESQLQHNQIVAMFHQKNTLIEHQEDNNEPVINISPSPPKKEKQKNKKPSKGKKGKKKK